MARSVVEAPVCNITGLPTPILPQELAERRALLVSSDNLCKKIDFHHNWWEENDPLLQDLAGKAVRYSMGQDINRTLHDRFNREFSHGPRLPVTSTEKFLATLYPCAGVVPRQALFLPKEGGHEIIELTDYEHAYLASTIHIEKYNHLKYGESRRRTIGRSFASYLLSQDLEGVVSKRTTGQFLSSRTSPDRRLELGNQILINVLGQSLNHFEPTHHELLKEGFVAPNRARQLGKAVRSYFTKEHFAAYHDELAIRLARA